MFDGNVYTIHGIWPCTYNLNVTIINMPSKRYSYVCPIHVIIDESVLNILYHGVLNGSAEPYFLGASVDGLRQGI